MAYPKSDVWHHVLLAGAQGMTFQVLGMNQKEIPFKESTKNGWLIGSVAQWGASLFSCFFLGGKVSNSFKLKQKPFFSHENPRGI